jgi:hypothetical protein
MWSLQLNFYQTLQDLVFALEGNKGSVITKMPVGVPWGRLSNQRGKIFL